MIVHIDLGDSSFGRGLKLKVLIDKREIQFGGNKKLKIYGRLDCTSGKRMKAANRVFFSSETEAKDAGYRPCGHCMRKAYSVWKAALPKSSRKETT